MKKRISVGIIILIISCLAWLLIKRDKSTILSRLDATQGVSGSSTPVAPLVATNQTNLNTPTPTPSAILNIDPKALIIEKIMTVENATAQDFYGKVVDQNGAPVVGAKATGTLMKRRGIDVGEKMETFTTMSDHDGDFQFTGLHGWQLGVVVSKPGYEIRQAAGVFEAPNREDVSTPSQRAIFHMWKLQGADALIRAGVHANLPCDGTTESFSLTTGRRKGDLQVSLTRNPVEIDRSKPFNWSVTIAIANGGLQEITDTYPNEAPVDGYQQSITINMSATQRDWSPQVEKSYYFQSGGNKMYGRMDINIMANFQPPPTPFDADIYANPTGSRNLEYDPSKRSEFSALLK